MPPSLCPCKKSWRHKWRKYRNSHQSGRRTRDHTLIYNPDSGK